MSEILRRAKAALRAAESVFNEIPAGAPRAQADHAIRLLNDARVTYNRAWEEERRRFLTRREDGRVVR